MGGRSITSYDKAWNAAIDASIQAIWKTPGYMGFALDDPIARALLAAIKNIEGLKR